MKALIIVLALICLGSPYGWAQENLNSRINHISLATDDSLAYGNDYTTYGMIIPTVQVAQWKDGYVVTYVNSNWHSKLFFTDAQFNKTSKEYELANRIVYQVVTDNGEIALLAADKQVDSDGDIFSNFMYFIKFSASGGILMEKTIIGSNHIKRPNETELDDWGNYLMKWTGHFYVTFFPIQHNFRKIAPPDIHQGDCTYFIKPDGSILSYSDWGASHSFEQRMAIGEDYLIQVAKGDAYPRGLAIDYVAINNYEIEELERGWKDQNNPDLNYGYDPIKSFNSSPYKVSGSLGANYVPFSLGDVVILEKNAAIVSFSTKDKKTAHDIGILTTRPQFGYKGKVKYITNTPTICEHSVRMARVAENGILIMWKQFDVKTAKKKIAQIEKRLDTWDADEEIFRDHNLDQNMMAMIDTNGKYLSKPQKVTHADWYYTISLKEFQTPWHDIIDGYANHSYSPFLHLHNGNLAWAHHQHKAKQIDIYSLVK